MEKNILEFKLKNLKKMNYRLKLLDYLLWSLFYFGQLHTHLFEKNNLSIQKKTLKLYILIRFL
jgi:hypothetical protein